VSIPAVRISEILFGVIMVLTFTGALGVATADRLEIRAMLIAALGCNLVWGVIDAGMFLMARLQERGRNLRMFRAARDTADEATARRVVAEALPPILVSVLPKEDLEKMRRALRTNPEPPRPWLAGGSTLWGAPVFFLV